MSTDTITGWIKPVVYFNCRIVVDCAASIPETFLPLTIVRGSICCDALALTMFHAILPLSCKAHAPS